MKIEAPYLSANDLEVGAGACRGATHNKPAGWRGDLESAANFLEKVATAVREAREKGVQTIRIEL